MIDEPPLREEISTRATVWIQWFNELYKSLRNIDVVNGSTFASNVIINGTLTLNGQTGITETLTFNGSSSGQVATLTVTNGIITARTLVP